MSRKLWIILLSTAVLLIVLASCAVAALFLVPRYRATRDLAQARDFAASGQLEQSRRFYQEYLFRNDSDIAALEEYIGICEQIVTDRRRSLLAAGRAYMKIALKLPDEPQRKQDVLDFYQRHLFWPEFESALIVFYGLDVEQLSDELAYEKAVAVQHQGRESAALAEFESYLGLNGSTRVGAPLRDVPIRLARIYVNAEKQDKADELFKTLKEQRPDDPFLHITLAEYLTDQKKADEALAQLELVSGDMREDSAFLLAAIRAHNLKEDYGISVELARRAIEVDGDNPDTHQNYLFALEKNGARDQAIAHIEGLDPIFRVDTPGLLMYLFELELDRNDADAAGKVVEEFASAYPDLSATEVYLNGRVLLFRSNENDDEEMKREARDHFKMAVEMNPGLDRARFLLAMTEIELKNAKAAQTPLEVYLRNNPLDEQAQRVWDTYFGTARSIAELRFAANRMLSEPDPNLERIQYMIQDLAGYRDEEDQALVRQLMEKVIEVAPTDPRGYNTLGTRLLERNELEAAEIVLQNALSAGVPRSEVAILESSLLLMKGESERAYEIAASTLEEAPLETAKTWAALFARNGQFSLGDQLLVRYSAQMDKPDVAASALEFRHSLAIRYGTRELAMERLQEGEAVLADKPDQLRPLNDMRLSTAQALIAGIYSADSTAKQVDALLEKVRFSNPNSDGLKVVEAQVALAAPLPDFLRARDLVSSIPETSRSYDAALIVLSEIAAKQGKFEEAVTWANKALERSSRNVLALYMLGQAQFDLRNLSEARTALERILEIDPSDTRAMRLLVRIYTDMRLPQLAQRMLTRYEGVSGNNGNAEVGIDELRSYASRSPGDLNKLEEKLRDEIANSPDNYVAVSGLVRALVGQGKYPEAVKVLKAYLKDNPDAAEPWVQLGYLILEQGSDADLSEASTAFTRAQIIVPEYGPAQLGLVDVQARLNNLEIAISMCRRYLSSRGADANGLYRLATLLSRDPARHQEALETIQRAIEVGEQPDFVRLEAFLFTSLGQYDDAVASLERLRSQTSTSLPDDSLTLAEAYLGKGDLDQARSFLAEAREDIAEGDQRLLARAQRMEDLIAKGGVQ